MRSTQLITGALAVAATSALVGLAAAPTDAKPAQPERTSAAQERVVAKAAPGVTRERGVLLECRGTLGDRPVIVSLYENRTHGNFLEIQVGEEGGGSDDIRVSRETDRRFVRGTKVRAGANMVGKKATITGTAKPTGKVKRVHEVIEDAGERIVSTGTHRRLKTRVKFAYDGESTKLTCSPAFIYKLKVTKTSIVD
jgi:hypothetical protein